MESDLNDGALPERGIVASLQGVAARAPARGSTATVPGRLAHRQRRRAGPKKLVLPEFAA